MQTLAHFTGQARVQLINGDIFQGSFDEGHREGHGKLTFGTLNKRKLELQSVEGNYNSDVLEGYGYITYASGEKLSCDFMNGIPIGPAKLFDTKGRLKQVILLPIFV